MMRHQYRHHHLILQVLLETILSSYQIFVFIMTLENMLLYLGSLIYGTVSEILLLKSILLMYLRNVLINTCHIKISCLIIQLKLLSVEIDLSLKLCLHIRYGYRGTSVPASVTSLIDWNVNKIIRKSDIKTL